MSKKLKASIGVTVLGAFIGLISGWLLGLASGMDNPDLISDSFTAVAGGISGFISCLCFSLLFIPLTKDQDSPAIFQFGIFLGSLAGAAASVLTFLVNGIYTASVLGQPITVVFDGGAIFGAFIPGAIIGAITSLILTAAFKKELSNLTKDN
jgi:hypothetical protein